MAKLLLIHALMKPSMCVMAHELELNQTGHICNVTTSTETSRTICCCQITGKTLYVIIKGSLVSVVYRFMVESDLFQVQIVVYHNSTSDTNCSVGQHTVTVAVSVEVGKLLILSVIINMQGKALRSMQFRCELP